MHGIDVHVSTPAERIRPIVVGVLKILLAALTAIGWVAILLRVVG
jgi:hypothetical protein